MTYEELVSKLKSNYEGMDAGKIKEHVAIQFNVAGEAEGALYMEIADGKINIEPYEYYDRDILVYVETDALLAIADGELAIYDAFKEGKFYAEGNLGKADLLDAISKKAAAKKSASKKKVTEEAVEEKKTGTKPVEGKKVEAKPVEEKKTESKPVEEKKAEAKPVEKKKTEPVAEKVIEKSVKTKEPVVEKAGEEPVTVEGKEPITEAVKAESSDESKESVDEVLARKAKTTPKKDSRKSPAKK